MANVVQRVANGQYYHAECLIEEFGKDELSEPVDMARLDNDDMCKACSDPLIADPDDDADDDDKED